MEQNELIMQAARLINTASTECAAGHTEVANAKLIELYSLLGTGMDKEPPKEPANPADAPQT